MPSSLDTVRVVLFSGGRGSGVLSKQLLKDPHIRLTLAINGYDDGASTGEVRRFLGDSLGPSDFRKNASRLALELGTCPPSLVEMLDARLPDGLTRDEALAAIRQRSAGTPSVAERVEAFARELESSGRPFNFNDCSLGNLVFAGSFLQSDRRIQSGGRRLLFAGRIAAGRHRERHGRLKRLSRRHRRGRGGSRQRRRDRRCARPEPDSGNLSHRSSAVRRRSRTR